MSIIQTLPVAPSRDRPAEFSDEADAFLSALPDFGDECNVVAGEVNDNAAQVSTDTGTVNTDKGIVLGYKNDTAADTALALGYRDAAGNSASASSDSAFASAASEDLAEKWAEESEDVQVSGGAYSAKHWAAKAEESATNTHNNLTGLQGGSGDPAEYYHLTEDEHTAVSSGNMASATKLETARTIGGTPFDGTVNITPAMANLSAEATKLQNARTIGLSGDISATAVFFDGTTNIEINASVNNDSHSHTSVTLPTTPNATTSVRGIVELATTAEAAAGTDTTRAVTAAGLAAFNVIPAHGAVGAILIAWHAAGTYDFGDTIAGSSLVRLITSDGRGGLGFRSLPDTSSAGLSMNGAHSGWVSCGVSGTWSARSTSSAATDRHSPNIWIRIA